MSPLPEVLLDVARNPYLAVGLPIGLGALTGYVTKSGTESIWFKVSCYLDRADLVNVSSTREPPASGIRSCMDRTLWIHGLRIPHGRQGNGCRCHADRNVSEIMSIR